MPNKLVTDSHVEVIIVKGTKTLSSFWPFFLSHGVWCMFRVKVSLRLMKVGLGQIYFI